MQFAGQMVEYAEEHNQVERSGGGVAAEAGIELGARGPLHQGDELEHRGRVGIIPRQVVARHRQQLGTRVDPDVSWPLTGVLFHETGKSSLATTDVEDPQARRRSLARHQPFPGRPRSSSAGHEGRGVAAVEASVELDEGLGRLGLRHRLEVRSDGIRLVLVSRGPAGTMIR